MRILKSLPALVCMALFIGFTLQARAGTIYDSPYVTFAPDGMAWTTNAGDKNIVWYPQGEIVTTGIVSSVRNLREGEHYYQADRAGQIPIGRWEVLHSPARCIHAVSNVPDVYHGITFGGGKCLRSYYSGWLAYCADCGEPIRILMYMSRDAAGSLSYLYTDTAYYYACPFCNHLEQGARINHECKKISANRYKVVYNKNALSAKGCMGEDIFMYGNATEYEGVEVAPKQRLTGNTYTRTGYRFAGWNTERDGSGTYFADKQEVLNLSADNWTQGDDSRGVVTLYALWEVAESTLSVDPNGGLYGGKAGITEISRTYGSSIDLSEGGIQPPQGYLVTFETNGGTEVEPIRSRLEFDFWEKGNPFNGYLKGSLYQFTAAHGQEDYVKCIYRGMPITLPTPTCVNKEFGGWYSDENFDTPAGMGGEQYLPTGDTVLYACWVDLSLTATNNYEANDKAGAVDLKWKQGGTGKKYYKLYQSTDRRNWSLIKKTNAEQQGAAGASSLPNSGGEGSTLEGVPAKDLKAPDMVDISSVVVYGLQREELTVTWGKPKDYGTVYYHKAESYRKGENTVLCTSNITRNELCVGIKGYYVLKNTRPDTVVTEKNGHFVSNARYSFGYNAEEEQTVFLHITAVDYAGNISETVHIEIAPGESIRVLWSVYTDLMTIQPGDNVYQSGTGLIYVRADGETPFVLNGGCRLAGSADSAYRPTGYGIRTEGGDEMWLCMVTNAADRTDTEEVVEERNWRTWSDSAFPLGNSSYTKVTRSATGEGLTVDRAFLAGPELNGRTVHLYPYGAAACEESVTESDAEEDLLKGLYLCGDGEGPLIKGGELLEQQGVEAFLGGEYELIFETMDKLSGVRDFYVTIFCEDKNMTQIVRPSLDGKIHIRAGMIDENLWKGTVSISVAAIDNVGNRTTEEYKLEKLWVTASVARILAPHEPLFRGGESGVLTVHTGGNAERLEILFPNALYALDNSLRYELALSPAQYSSEVTQTFMIPLYALPSDDYEIVVRAYKGADCAEAHPGLTVLEGGNVLKDLRTRLR